MQSMKTILLLAVLAAAALPAAGDPLVEKVVGAISRERLEAHVRKLASFGTRHTLSETASETRGIGAARRWIKAELEACSKGTALQVAFDEHDLPVSARVPRPTTLVNVVAVLPGTQPESRARTYVVSGHYDSRASDVMDATGDAPGANDDASGTAVSMELACVMSKHAFDATIVFMAVAGEEQGLLGAGGYARAAKAKGVDIAGMITNDIVGNTVGQDGRQDRGRLRVFAQGVPVNPRTIPDELATLMATGGENDLPTRQLARAVKAAADKYVRDFRVDIVWRRDRYLRGGDHSPFLDAGYPALRFTEPYEDWRRQHQDIRKVDGVQYGDLPEFVDYAYLANVARVNAAAIASLALAPAAPRNVGMETLKLEIDTTLRWEANREPDLAGYRVVWRETTAPDWQHARDVGNVTRATLEGVSKDDFIFGVQAVDRDGNVSPAAYPRPARTR